MKAMETRGCLHVERYVVVMQLFLSRAQMTVLISLCYKTCLSGGWTCNSHKLRRAQMQCNGLDNLDHLADLDLPILKAG